MLKRSEVKIPPQAPDVPPPSNEGSVKSFREPRMGGIMLMMRTTVMIVDYQLSYSGTTEHDYILINSPEQQVPA